MAAQPPVSASSTTLWQRVNATYDTALQSGAISKTETNDEIVRDQQLGVPFVLRVAAALRSKPRPAAPKGGGGRPANPFLPPEEALVVAQLSDTHTLLLNKFNVVAHHVLVVTRKFQHQTDALNAADFEATLQVLRAMPSGGVAFFNCGEHSGASQPHKHLQVVPLPFMPGQPPQVPFAEILSDATSGSEAAAVPVRQLPWCSYAARIDIHSTSGEELASAASKMLQQAQSSCPSEGPLSYNVLLSLRFLQLIPRRTEFSGDIAVNSLGPAGTMFVKQPEHLMYIRQHTPAQVLKDICYPWPSA